MGTPSKNRSKANFIAQNAAFYSSTPIKTVIEDTVELASQQQRIENIRLDDYGEPQEVKGIQSKMSMHSHRPV